MGSVLFLLLAILFFPKNCTQIAFHTYILYSIECPRYQKCKLNVNILFYYIIISNANIIIVKISFYKCTVISK